MVYGFSQRRASTNGSVPEAVPNKRFGRIRSPHPDPESDGDAPLLMRDKADRETGDASRESEDPPVPIKESSIYSREY